MENLVAGSNLYPHTPQVSQQLLREIVGHNSGVFWLSGLSGAGKSTIAHAIELELVKTGHRCFVLDGDTLRAGLNKDLTFGDEARRENLRRAGEVVKLLIASGQIVIASFISPFAEERQMVREIVGENFFEVYVSADLQTCETRDTKGMYKKARAGQIPKFTGISSPYEIPQNPDLILDSRNHTVDECVKQFFDFMKNGDFILENCK